MSRPARIAARIVSRQLWGSLPPVGAMPMSIAVAGVPADSPMASASSSVATIGMSNRGASPSHSRTLRPAFVESMTATTGSGP